MNSLFGKIINNKIVKDQTNKASVIHYFEERLNEFHSEFSDNEEKIVKSSNYVADRLLAILEAIFLHGLKETLISQLSTVIGNDVDKTIDINFWHCLLILSPGGVVDHVSVNDILCLIVCMIFLFYNYMISDKLIKTCYNRCGKMQSLDSLHPK